MTPGWRHARCRSAASRGAGWISSARLARLAALEHPQRQDAGSFVGLDLARHRAGVAPVVGLGLRVGAGFEQQLGIGRAAGIGSHVQRRGAIVVARVGVGAGRDQRLHGAGVGIRRGQVQRRRTKRRACITLFRVGLEQALDIVAAAGAGRIVDRLVVARYLGNGRRCKATGEQERDQALHGETSDSGERVIVTGVYSTILDLCEFRLLLI